MLHVIALSKNEQNICIYKDDKIYVHSPKDGTNKSFDYQEKIREIALGVDKGLYEWVDLNIENGQKISMYEGKYSIDQKQVQPFNKLSEEEFSNIGAVTTKIYSEFLCSKEKEQSGLREILKMAHEEGAFTNQISNIVENYYQQIIEPSDLGNLDKQIIIRIKIEGYKYIINFMKNILESGHEKRYEYCDMFMSRVFVLESQNYIKL